MVGAPQRPRGGHALVDGVFETEYAAIEPLAGWVLRQNGRAPLEPDELRTACAEGLRHPHAHEAEPPKLARLDGPRAPADGTERPAPPVAPERFGVLQALLAYLLAACGDTKEAELDADDLAPLPHPATSCRITSRCSTSSTSAAAATRSTPSSTATASTSTRSSTATSSGSPRG